MRRLAMLLALPTLAAVPLAAQGFEGTITMTMPANSKGAPPEMTYMMKGNMVALEMALPAGSGPVAGKSMHMIMDMNAMKTTMLIPMEGMGGSKGMKMTMDMNKTMADAQKGSQPVVKDLGTSETIAGHTCEDFSVTQKDDVTNMCLAKDLGHFAFPSSPMSGKGGTPDWAKAFGPNIGFPLKVWDAKDSKVMMQATSVKPGSVPADAFTIPDGYMDMSGMMGRGMTGGRGGPQ